jgi:hypothetical protein
VADAKWHIVYRWRSSRHIPTRVGGLTQRVHIVFGVDSIVRKRKGICGVVIQKQSDKLWYQAVLSLAEWLRHPLMIQKSRSREFESGQYTFYHILVF